MKLENHQRILFTGDSITDCDRMEPQHAPFGWGYVRRFAELVDCRHPELDLEIVNTGIGGHTVEDLRDRWEDDVLSYRPDWLSIKVGINDVHQHLRADRVETMQSPENFAAIYKQILEVTRTRLPDTKLLLIAPFYASRDDTPGSFRVEVREILPEYTETIRRLSASFDTLLLETQPLFEAVFEHRHPRVFFPNEPVHPNPGGHMVLAEGVYKVLAE